MEIETLKRGAKWMGYIVYEHGTGPFDNLPSPIPYAVDSDNRWKYIKDFTFHEDANLLKKMVAKLTPEQFDKYWTWLVDEAPSLQWVLGEAPTKLCFEKLMEVI